MAFMVALAFASTLALWLIARLWRLVAGVFRRHSLHPAGA
jgi:hypothetical protein